jgi:Right handed beta helix region
VFRLALLLTLLGAVLPVAGCGGGHRAVKAGEPTTRHASPSRRGCDRYASPRGSNRHRGTRSAPYRTVKRLLRSLRRGRTGCLLAGTYRYSGVAHLRRPNTTLRSDRGTRARVDGTIWVDARARGAQVSGLSLTTHDRTFSIPLKVQADDVTITGNLITAARNEICVLIGSDRQAHGTFVEHNHISHCGRRGKLNHLLYLFHTRGAVVRDNVLTSNPGGWAVQLYSDADGTLIERNVIDGNYGGVVIAGNGHGETSDGNVVRDNAITFSRRRGNVEGSWSGGPTGTGNSVYRNCLYTHGPYRPSGLGPAEGFSASSNTVVRASPYVSRARGNYRFRRGSRCIALVGRSAGPSG